MKFELNRRESKQLMELVFIGNSIVNNMLIDEVKNSDYHNLAQKLYRQYLTAQNSAIPKKFEVKLKKLTEKLFLETIEDCTDYDDLSFYDKLAEKLASKNYPFLAENETDLHESLRTRTLARYAYYEMLCRQGEDFVEFSAPRIDEAIQKLREERYE